MSHLISDLRERWLEGKSHLSAHTLSTYAGEVRRFEEFCMTRHVRRVEQLSVDLWLAYTAVLRAGRIGTRSKRVENLSEGSARQAQRITRAFVRWLQENGLIGWPAPDWSAPEPANAEEARIGNKWQEPAKPRPRAAGLPAALLCGSASNDSEAEMRAQVAINLVFWAAMKPSELAMLHVGALEKLRGGLTCVLMPHSSSARFAPLHFWQTWLRYRRLREERFARRLDLHEPVLCGLNGEEALTTWTIWSIIKSTKVGIAMSPRALRAEFLRRLTSDASAALGLARDASGLTNLQPHMPMTVQRSSQVQISKVLARVSS